MSNILAEPWRFEFPYTRTAGPTVGKFLLGLQQKKIYGLRMRDGGILVPPHAHDPRTSETLTEWVEVGTTGFVASWTWIERPLPQHPLQRPFAYALIRLDGAGSDFFHVVDADSVADVATGMRVKVRWAAERRGHISDIACFVPIAADDNEDMSADVTVDDAAPERHRFDARFGTDYNILAGKALSLHLRGLQRRAFVGVRGPSGNVYFPPNGADPLTGEAVGDDAVTLPQTGTVVRYCIVNIPVRGQQVDVPFAAADILIDGADTTMMALLQGIPHADVRLGLRVRAVWKDGDELPPSMANVKWFEPTGEPDCELAKVEAYL